MVRNVGSAEDMRALGEARLAALKAGLMLTPEQARNWPAFEQAARDFSKLRIGRRMAMRSASPSSDPVEGLRRRATATCLSFSPLLYAVRTLIQKVMRSKFFLRSRYLPVARTNETIAPRRAIARPGLLRRVGSSSPDRQIFSG
jgi:hypothetical protein